jgi:hypothetical protein
MRNRIAITVGAAVATSYITWVSLSELVVRYEMWSTGVSSLAELGGVSGVTTLLFLVVPPGTIALTSVVAWVVWRILNRHER